MTIRHVKQAIQLAATVTKPGEFKALIMLCHLADRSGRLPPTTQSRLGARMALSRQAVGKHLEKLEGRGWVASSTQAGGKSHADLTAIRVTLESALAARAAAAQAAIKKLASTLNSRIETKSPLKTSAPKKQTTKGRSLKSDPEPRLFKDQPQQTKKFKS